MVGDKVGSALGLGVGSTVGTLEGLMVGVLLGLIDGSALGDPANTENDDPTAFAAAEASAAEVGARKAAEAI